MSQTDHVDAVTALRYVDEELPPLHREQAEDHFQVCGRCRRELEALRRETVLLRDSLVEEDEPLPAGWGERATPEVTGALAAMTVLAAAGAHTVWSQWLSPVIERLDFAGLGTNTALMTLFFRSIQWKGWTTMAETLMSGLVAAGALTALVAVLVVLSRARRLGGVALSLMVISLLPPRGEAAEIRKTDGDYTLPAGETVANDLIVMAVDIRIEGTVEGDLMAFGQSVVVEGTIRGDVLAFCQRARVAGRVEGSVRTASQTLDVTGSVGRNVTSGGQTLDLGDAAEVAGSVIAAGETVTIDARVGRDLLAAAARHRLGGTLGGSALLAGEALDVGSTAEVRGTTRFYGSRQPTVSASARLSSPVETHIVESRPRSRSLGYYWRRLLFWGAAFVLGMSVILLMPRFFGEAVGSLASWGTALGAGFLSLVAVPVAALVLSVTIVGLAVGLTAFFLYALALYAAQVFTGAWIGSQLLGSASSPGEWVKRLALGLLLLRAVWLVPYIGGLVWLVATILGLGAVTLTVWRRSQVAPAVA
jgi:cytoskeletal protein CcmA (bactofilin family)